MQAVKKVDTGSPYFGLLTMDIYLRLVGVSLILYMLSRGSSQFSPRDWFRMALLGAVIGSMGTEVLSTIAVRYLTDGAVLATWMVPCITLAVLYPYDKIDSAKTQIRSALFLSVALLAFNGPSVTAAAIAGFIYSALPRGKWYPQVAAVATFSVTLIGAFVDIRI